MREIKFRGKTLSGKWVYGYAAKLVHDSVPVILEDTKDGIEPRKVVPDTVGQFTGVLDKNGKEICEGDVVRFIDYTYTPLDGLKHEGYIAYNKGYFEIVVGDNLRYCLHSLQLWVYNHCEVIGNIHDNPTLITIDLGIAELPHNPEND